MAINTNIDFRNSQSFAIGSGTVVPAGPAGNAVATLNWQAARSLILGRLVVQTPLVGPSEVGTEQGLMTALTVQGSSLFCSNAPVPMSAFSPGLEEGQNFLGLGIPAAGVVQAQIAGLAGVATTQTGTIYCDPWNDDEYGLPPAPSESGASAENYIFGMGQTAAVVAPGAQFTLVATALRACILGRCFITIFDPAVPTFRASRRFVTIDQILINQTEQLGSQVPLTSAAGADAFGIDAKGDMPVLNAFVPMNGQVSIRFNVDAAAAAPGVLIGACFFCNAS